MLRIVKKFTGYYSYLKKSTDSNKQTSPNGKLNSNDNAISQKFDNMLLKSQEEIIRFDYLYSLVLMIIRSRSAYS